jgi:hypothetical protein
MVAYSGKNASVPRYQCHRGRLDTLEAKCLSFGGTSADAAVSNELLQVVRPGAIEAAVLAETQKQDIRAQRARALNLEVDEARYSAERAGRQYEASDPENRLVTAELERRWNAALQKAQELEAKAAKERCHDPSSCPDLASLGNLALDLEAVWLSHETDVRLKKRLIRALIEEVVVEVDEDRCEVELLIHWKGGLHSKQRIPRRRRGQGGPRTSTDVIDAVRQLAHLCRDKAIAGYLNRNGHLTARGHRWSRMSVTSLRTGQSIPVYSPETQDAAGWMNLTNAAAHLAIAPKTLRRAAEQGEIVALHPLKHGPWVFSRTDLDDPAFRRRMKARLSGQIPPTGPDLRQLNLMNSTTYRGEIL